MNFNKELSHKEITLLSKKDKLRYIYWLETNKKSLSNARPNDDKKWKESEFTLNNFSAARRDFLLKEERLPSIITKRFEATHKEEFSFFWETQSPLSQWYSSEFEAPSYMWNNSFYKQLIQKTKFPLTIKFSSAEQYMMYCKAMLFVDLEIAEQIINSITPREIKKLGRQVKRFNEDTWYIYRWQFVYTGNKYKFTQNEDIKEILFSTQGTTLVEASPYDKIWGIGLSKNDSKAQQRSTWEGKNLLGEILTELRIELMGHY